MVYPQVRAIYENGVLTLLDPLDLPEGTQVHLHIQSPLHDQNGDTNVPKFIHPTRSVSAEKLDNLIGLVAIGGDAITDSEALYDPDWS